MPHSETGVKGFNPHPTFRPDATTGQAPPMRLFSTFQPSSSLQAGSNSGAAGQADRAAEVSTLIQPSGRKQPRSPRWRPPVPRCFNPHPTFRPDATWHLLPTRASCTSVSTLIRPSGRMQLIGAVLILIIIWVSTLIRPSGRMQQASRLPTKVVPSRFQPSSDLQAGCNGIKEDAGAFFQVRVSTLIRPSGRMQRTIPHEYAYGGRCFNPHPTFRPDATPVGALPSAWWCFNPHPTFRPDATPRLTCHNACLQVSTLIRPSGRMQPSLAWSCPTDSRFQPSSDLQAGCN